VEEIYVETGPVAFTSAGIKEPKAGVEGKFSLWFLAALALAEGDVILSKFTDEKINDDRLIALRKKIDANLVRERKLGARVVVTMNDGEKFDEVLSHPKGSPENPLGFEEIAGKFRSAAALSIIEANITPLINKIERFETLQNIKEIFLLAEGKP
jgi:2-methylcitrate dehydratase PrpD